MLRYMQLTGKAQQASVRSAQQRRLPARILLRSRRPCIFKRYDINEETYRPPEISNSEGKGGSHLPR